MKELFRNSIILILFSMSVLAGCTSGEKQAGQAATRYTCPMHPQIVTEEPGTCPICKMDLVPVDGTNGHDADDSLAHLVKPTNQVVVSGIRTVKPSRGNRYGKESLRGVIAYDPENINSISSRVNGRIERLFVHYNFQRIAKGQKLMEIYSPDLAAAQTELLFLKSNGEMQLLESARQKLRLLGMTNEQIGRILRTGQVDYRVTVYSPYSGYLMTEPAGEPVSGGMAKTMITSSGSSGSMDGGPMAGMSGSSAPAAPVPAP
ncbi:MAG TPA: efflux RND transporter periplasmic adaptor subunit, partial [Sphingobacteriaceae bacterium]